MKAALVLVAMSVLCWMMTHSGIVAPTHWKKRSISGALKVTLFTVADAVPWRRFPSMTRFPPPMRLPSCVFM